MRTIMRQPALEAATGFPKSTTYYYIKHGLLPKPIKLGPRAVGFLSDEIEAVMNARIAGKSDAEIKTLVAELEEQRSQAGSAE
jgi:prophage regulatory protein